MASLLKAIELRFANFLDFFEKSKIISIEQPLSLHSDLFLVSLLVDALKGGKSVVFFAFRENFAHYSSLARRLGVSLEHHISNGQLTYIQAFFSSWNSDLPMTQISPATYTTPSNKIIHVTEDKSLMGTIKKLDLSKFSSVYIDCVNFLKSKAEVIYEIYQRSVESNNQLILGGQRSGSALATIFGKQADVRIVLEQNVGGFGRMRLEWNQMESKLLWKASQGKFQVSSSAVI